MGTNKYGHIGGIEEGHASYIPVDLGLKGDGFGGNGRFLPWTVNANVEWFDFPVGTTATDMVANNPNLNVGIDSVPLSDYMSAQFADEHYALIGHHHDGDRLYGFRKHDQVLANQLIAEWADVGIAAARAAGYHNATPVTAFHLDGGKKFVIGVFLGDYDWFDESGKRFAFFATSRDGSLANVRMSCDVLPQCINTFTAGYTNGIMETRFRNTKEVTVRLEQEIAAVRLQTEESERFNSELRSLITFEAGTDDLYRAVKHAYGDPPPSKEAGKRGRDPRDTWDARFAAIADEWYADHNDYCKDTALGIVMAINGYELWGSNRKDRIDSTLTAITKGNVPSAKALAFANGLVPF